MMAALKVALAFIKSPVGVWVTGAVLAVVMLASFVAYERHLQHVADLAADQKARAEAAAINAAAVAQADKERAADQAETDTLQKDLNRAYANTPDSRPSAARIALACGRLRAQHAEVSKLPACGGSGR